MKQFHTFISEAKWFLNDAGQVVELCYSDGKQNLNQCKAEIYVSSNFGPRGKCDSRWQNRL